MASHFQVTGHFETSALNYSKMTLSTKYMLQLQVSPKFHSVLLNSQPVFELQAILRQVRCTEWPQNDLEH